MAQIELKNHGMVDIDTQLTAATFMDLQDEGIVDKDFLDKIVNATAEADLPLRLKLNTLYAAYREANKVEYLSYEEFIRSYQIDYIQLTYCIGAVITKQDVETFSGFADSLMKKIPKSAGSSGK
ncbi:TPA: hypothetical protein ACKPC6_002361 [Listeria monocytogenes]|uniref:Uncharacterized protein n=2 Tax=Listeria TaxID=1637 RepID=A0A9P1SWS8_LISMN|nr:MULTISPECIES: hypothetical protein [Listeria]MCZ64197.1 hypothetical protein [Listeria monocytogenes serotype 4b]EAA0129583.1 hypothetical protein [Listeria monocytogenes]EAC2291053.1 hypothetical protein [Listeria monocytogenes]EAC2303805.1 hypothetical protein [Listeria monocytogenes]EAC3065864.1 hypothetical protein [Listeria monocytogenes]